MKNDDIAFVQFSVNSQPYNKASLSDRRFHRSCEAVDALPIRNTLFRRKSMNSVTATGVNHIGEIDFLFCFIMSSKK